MNWVPPHILNDKQLQKHIGVLIAEQRARTFMNGARMTNPQLELELVGGKNPIKDNEKPELDSGL
jgi:hypothetical protein